MCSRGGYWYSGVPCTIHNILYIIICIMRIRKPPHNEIISRKRPQPRGQPYTTILYYFIIAYASGDGTSARNALLFFHRVGGE